MDDFLDELTAEIPPKPKSTSSLSSLPSSSSKLINKISTDRLSDNCHKNDSDKKTLQKNHNMNNNTTLDRDNKDNRLSSSSISSSFSNTSRISDSSSKYSSISSDLISPTRTSDSSKDKIDYDMTLDVSITNLSSSSSSSSPPKTNVSSSIHSVLIAICDTFIPSLSWEETNTLFQHANTLKDSQPTKEDLKIFATLKGSNFHIEEDILHHLKYTIHSDKSRVLFFICKLLSTGYGTGLLSGIWSPFPSLSQEKRESILLSWSQSSFAAKKLLFKCLKQLILNAFYIKVSPSSLRFLFSFFFFYNIYIYLYLFKFFCEC